MMDRMFLDHPRAVGESYFEHLGVAGSFGLRMIGGGIACLLHGLVPAFCTSTGSRTISLLHERMVVSRRRAHPAHGSAAMSVPVAIAE